MAAPKKIIENDFLRMSAEGASISQLSGVFRMDRRDVAKRLVPLKPAGERGGFPVYDFKEACRYLAEPLFSIEEYVAQMNHTDLPMMLRKEYWAGRRSQQLYEIANGDLWRTEQVIEHETELFKTIKMSLLLVHDTVERESELTAAQRQIIHNLIDSALQNAQKAVLESLSQSPADDGSELEHNE